TALGAVANTVADQLAASPQLADLFAQMRGAGPGDGFIALVLLAVSPIAAVYAIQATLRLRAEETGGRADSVLATSAGRPRWAASHLVFAGGGPAVLLAALGVTIGLGYGLGTGDVSGQLPRVLAAAMAYLPAVWVMAGLAAALYGLLPRLAAPVSWAALAVEFVIELAAEVRQLGQPVVNISPFLHIPDVLLDSEVSAAPLLWLAAVAAVLATAGLVGVRRRDIG
ncbi:MAG: ABC transporter permease, partial [Egibacteraceae bacterium]